MRFSPTNPSYFCCLAIKHTGTHTHTHTHTYDVRQRLVPVIPNHSTCIVAHSYQDKGCNYTQVHTGIHTFTHRYTHTGTHTGTHTQVHIGTHRYTQVHTGTHTGTHTQVHTHRHTHTGTHRDHSKSQQHRVAPQTCNMLHMTYIHT